MIPQQAVAATQPPISRPTPLRVVSPPEKSLRTNPTMETVDTETVDTTEIAAEAPLTLDVELQRELDARNAELESATPETIIQWAADRFGNRLTFATAFGPEGMVILHRISQLGLDIHCFNLDTGYQFAETLRLRDQVAEKLGIEVELCQPELSVEEFEARHGKLYLTDPNRCCQERKIKVLRRAIAGKHGWISAIRRDQSPDRARAPIVGWDAKFNLVKVNPLANLTKSDIWRTILDNDIPYNPLHDQGYPSIGCQPCTRPVQIGEDERAGRWSGTTKTECGLHSLDR